jgi:hypothetical protein
MEFSRVLLSGVFLSGAALTILGAVRLLGPKIILDPRRLLADHSYLSSHLILVMWSAGWFLALSLTLGAYAASTWPGDPVIHSTIESSWVLVFARVPQQAAARQNKPSPSIVVEATLKDGRTYKGLLADYSKNIDRVDRELVLGGPLTTVVGDGRSVSLSEKEWHRVILPASEITSILVRYRAQPDEVVAAHAARLANHADAPRYRKAIANFRSVTSWWYGNRKNSACLGALLIAEVIILLIVAVS